MLSENSHTNDISSQNEYIVFERLKHILIKLEFWFLFEIILGLLFLINT